MPWTTPRIWVAYDVVSSSRINDIRDDIRYLHAPWSIVRTVNVATTASHNTSAFVFWGKMTNDAPFIGNTDIYLGFLNTPKQENDTALFVTFSVTALMTSSGSADYALWVNGVDWGGQILTIDPPTFLYPSRLQNIANHHRNSFGTFKIKPLPKGVYDIWLRVNYSGAGAYQVTNADGGSMTIIEHWDAVD